LLVRIARDHRLDHHADFGPSVWAREAGFHWFEFSPRGLIGKWKRSDFSGDAVFDPCASKFTDRLRRRFEPARFAPRCLLVAVGFSLAVVYFVFISRRYAGKVSAKRDTQGFY